ncbi:MAG: lipoprotein-releasing system ATP-binding protein [Chitinophagales bacterium]|jgi:lipoprotein-releasing system ATP-binding protein
MKKTVLETKNLNKYFRKPVNFHVLKDISLSIKEGEFVSIMGKSGCEKSTLLYILSTMDGDYDGKLFLDGIELSGKSGNDLARIRNEKIGFVFQFHYLLPEFSVPENMMLPAKKLAKKSLAEIKEDALSALRLLGIEKQAYKKASMISGGQKQRVAIARALINDPKIIMGDEPTGNLDSNNSDNVFNIFKQLSEGRGLSLLVVTHDEDFAKKSDRIITIGDGTVES